MKRVISVSRVLAVLKTAAVLLLVSGGAHAQLGTLNNGFSSPNLGLPSVSPPGTTSTIPLGATQLNPGGLSPAPFAAMPGLPFSSPGVAGNIGMGAVAGSGSSSGTGLSPMPAPGFPALTPSGTAPGLAFPNITNFGAGGMQPLPGSPSTAR
jgi:hypothetical protein